MSVIPFAAPAAAPVTPPPPRDRLLRMVDVQRIVGLGRSRVYELIREGKFPRPLRVGMRTAVWSERAVMQWVQDCVNQGGLQ